MKRLPEPLRARNNSEKLLWLYLHGNPGAHSSRSLAEGLGGKWATWASALAALIEAGWVAVEQQPAGAKPGEYRAVREVGEGKGA